MNLHVAKLALASAIAEKQRVDAGSPTQQQFERPERDLVSLADLEKAVKSAQARVEMYRKLQAGGASSRVELLNAESLLETAQLTYDQAKVDAGTSKAGLPNSKDIAQNAVNEAQVVMVQRQLELTYCSVIAPASGTVDRNSPHRGV